MQDGGIINKPSKSGGDDRRGLAGKYGQAMLLGTNLAVGMAIFAMAGYYLDRRRGGGIFWTVCGMILGLLYGAYEIWKIVILLNAVEKGQKRPDMTEKKDVK